MSEAEEQLRRVLREHAADSEDLLEQVKHDEYEAGYARGERVGRELGKNSLSALREAVGPVLESVRKVVVMAKDWGPAFKSIRIEMDLDSARAFIAAHDGAQMAPTLRLEEVDEETCDHCGMQPSKGHSYMPVYGDELPQMCPLAQKVAGRGE